MRPLVLLAALALTWSALDARTLGAQTSPQPTGPGYLVIAHPNNPLRALDQDRIADIFLKKVAFWPNNERIRPIDLPPSSSARKQFSRDVLRRSVQAVKAYWQQRIFSGLSLPPPELATDAAVVDYVLANRGAIGYVSGSAILRGARVLFTGRPSE